MEITVKSASQRRLEIQANATRMGIDDAYISLLVETFYERIRDDERLGPIFDVIIGDNWEPHLAKMKDFWASVAFNAGRYSGKPVPQHMKLTNVTPEDFQIWLGLFRKTLEDTAPTPEVVPYLMEKAERIATSLQYAMFPLPDLLAEQPDSAPAGK